MKKSWDIESNEMIPMRVSFEEYNQLLDEMAELVYGYLGLVCPARELR